MYVVTVPFLYILNITTGERAEKRKIWNGMGPKRVRIRPLRYAYLPMKLRCPTCANIDTPVDDGGGVAVT